MFTSDFSPGYLDIFNARTLNDVFRSLYNALYEDFIWNLIIQNPLIYSHRTESFSSRLSFPLSFYANDSAFLVVHTRPDSLVNVTKKLLSSYADHIQLSAHETAKKSHVACITGVVVHHRHKGSPRELLILIQTCLNERQPDEFQIAIFIHLQLYFSLATRVFSYVKLNGPTLKSSDHSEHI